MTHPAFVSKMTEYILDEIEGKELSDFQNHLEGCEECSAELASLEKVLNVYGTVPFDMPSNVYFTSLVPQIRAKLEERDTIFSRFNWLFSIRWTGAVSVVIVAVVSTFLLLNIQNTVLNEDDQGVIVYYSGALQTEIYTVAAISETFDSEDWDYLSGIIDDEIGEYRNIFDIESEDFYSVEFLANEEWEEFYKNFKKQQIL